MTLESDCSLVDGGHHSGYETSNRVRLIAFVGPLVLLGCVSALAETLTVTEVNGLEVSYSSNDPDDRHGSYELALVSIDDTFTLRDPSDPVVYEYLLQGQASADADCLLCNHAAGVTGNVEFKFDLPDTVSLWDIDLDYEYHGVVAIDSGFGASGEYASAEIARNNSTGVVSSLGTTAIVGVEEQNRDGVEHFDGQRSEQVTGVFAVNAPGAVSFYIRLYARSSKDPGQGGGEAYSSLGHRSGLGGFDLDNSYYDPEDGLQVRLTFTPHLNLSGQTIQSDLALADGERLSGYGAFYGDISAVAGSAIISSSGDLVLGNPFSATGFNTAGDMAVGGGALTLNDVDAAVLGGTRSSTTLARCGCLTNSRIMV